MRHVEQRFMMTKGHNRETKIFNVLFDPCKIPADLVWKNIGGPEHYIQRTELPGLPTLCNMLGHIFVRLKIVEKPYWHINDTGTGWWLVVCILNSFWWLPRNKTSTHCAFQKTDVHTLLISRLFIKWRELLVRKESMNMWWRNRVYNLAVTGEDVAFIREQLPACLAVAADSWSDIFFKSYVPFLFTFSFMVFRTLDNFPHKFFSIRCLHFDRSVVIIPNSA